MALDSRESGPRDRDFARRPGTSNSSGSRNRGFDPPDHGKWPGERRQPAYPRHGRLDERVRSIVPDESRPPRPVAKPPPSRPAAPSGRTERRVTPSRAAGRARPTRTSAPAESARVPRQAQPTKSRPRSPSVETAPSKTPRGPAWLGSLTRSYRRVPRVIRYALAGIVALIALSMIIDAIIFSNKIHTGVTIEGLSVSGLTQDEAVSVLNQYVDRVQTSPITLTSGDQSWNISPSSIGVKMDIAGAVAAAMEVTRENNHVVDLVTKLKLYFGDRDIPLDGSVDAAGLEAVVDQIAEELDQPAVNAALLIRGSRVTEIAGTEGLVVDRDLLGQQLASILLSLHSTELPVPMVVDMPEVTAEDNEAAFAQTKTMIGGPLTLTSGEESWTLSTRELASYIDFTSKEVNGVSTLVPFISAEKMATRFKEIGEALVIEAENATFNSDGEKAWVVPAVEGKALDPDKTAEALTQGALSTAGRNVEAVLMTTEPELTTAAAEALGIKDLLASYKTTHWSDPARQHNVRLTTEYATAGENGILAPGEEYSFLQAVGPRTYARGFKKALGIVPGITLEYVYGGGICQVSTTMFNAVLEAGLEITERRNHTMYFVHYPRGRDATVTDNGPDFRFVNDTGHYVMLTGESDGHRTTIYVYGTDDGRKVDLKVGDWYGIFGPYTQTTLDNTIASGSTVVVDEGAKGKMCMLTRTITWPDGKTKKDQFESFYRTQPRIVRVGTGTTTTTLAPPTTVAPPTTASP